MRRLFARAGVDYVQWRALMRAYYLIDVGPLLGAHGSKETLLAVARLLLAILFYAFLGGGVAVLVLAARDPLVGAVAMTATTMWLTAMSVLFQSSSLILPDDYALLGFQPLTSRTYLAVRAGALIAQSLQTAALAGWVPVLAFLLRPDASWRFAIGAVFAVAGSAIAATLAVVVLCSSLLLVVPARRLQRAISYAQIGSLLCLAAGYAFVWMSLMVGGRAAIAAHVDFAFPRHAALLAMPPTWFGSYVAIAGGSAGRYEMAAALLSAATIVVLALSLGGRLSAGYAVRVAQLATASAEHASPPRWTPAFLRGERRAMGLLLAGQLRGDPATQTAALMSALTTGIIVVAGGASMGLPQDPFVRVDADVLPFLVFMMVPNLRDALTRTPQYEASWPLFTTPADRTALIVGSRDAIAACGLAPVLLILGALFMYSFGHVGHALLHLAVTAALAFIVLQLHVIAVPSLPFSRPFQGGRRPMVAGLLALPLVGAGTGISMVFQFVLYHRLAWTTAGLLGLAGIVVALNRVTRWRAAHQAAAYAE